MTAQEYLENRIKNCTKYALTEKDRQYIKNESIEEYILRVLTRKKFRKWKLDDDVRQAMKEVISKNVKESTPIQLVFPFGGYKLWRIPSAPEVDWAEFFVIAHCLEYISPILPAYKAGVMFYYSSDDIIVEKMDNIPTVDTDRYFNSFKILLKNFQKYFPKNLGMDIKRIADFYPNKNKFLQELDEMVKKTEEVFKTMDKSKIREKVKSSKLNFQFDGAEDLTGLSEEGKRNKINFGPILHDAYCKMTDRRLFIRGGDRIVIFTTQIPNAITIGTTKSSIAKFWTGFGVLEEKGDSFSDRILSPRQLEQSKKQEYRLGKMDLISLQNFKEIRVFAKGFDFVNKK